MRELIDRDGDGNANELVDDKTTWDSGSGEFEPLLKMDSRRKIPNVENDRAITVLLPNAAGAGSNLSQYDRVIVAKRSIMSPATSVLRETPENAGAMAFWRYSTGSLWDSGNPTAAAGAIDTSYQFGLDLDVATDEFRQNARFSESRVWTSGKKR